MTAPSELRVTGKGAILDIAFADGERIRLSAATLRRNLRSAGALRARIDGRPDATDGVRIVAVDTVGNYAVNIAFSDGEQRGIFPWAYLRELAAAEVTAT